MDRILSRWVEKRFQALEWVSRVRCPQDGSKDKRRSTSIGLAVEKWISWGWGSGAEGRPQ